MTELGQDAEKSDIEMERRSEMAEDSGPVNLLQQRQQQNSYDMSLGSASSTSSNFPPPETHIARGDWPSGSWFGNAQALTPLPGEMSPKLGKHGSTLAWTSVTLDQGLIEHLFSLYFYWEHSVFACFSEKHFREDYSAGRERFCSSLLVNAIMSLACHFSDQIHLHLGLRSEQDAGDRFFEEAQNILHERLDDSLPTIQALALMSLRAASCGHRDLSSFYASESARLALKARLHVLSTASAGTSIEADQAEVLSYTIWGVFGVDT